jgi:ferredoxin-like protein FixX
MTNREWIRSLSSPNCRALTGWTRHEDACHDACPLNIYSNISQHFISETKLCRGIGCGECRATWLDRQCLWPEITEKPTL